MFILKVNDYIEYIETDAIDSMVWVSPLSKRNDQLIVLQLCNRPKSSNCSFNIHFMKGKVWSCAEMFESIGKYELNWSKIENQPHCCGNIFVTLAPLPHKCVHKKQPLLVCFRAKNPNKIAFNAIWKQQRQQYAQASNLHVTVIISNSKKAYKNSRRSIFWPFPFYHSRQ